MTKSIFSRDHITLVEKLKKIRKDCGLGQTEVARLLNKTQSYVSKVESGQRRVDIVTLKEFAHIYKKPIEYFLK